MAEEVLPDIELVRAAMMVCTIHFTCLILYIILSPAKEELGIGRKDTLYVTLTL